MAVSRRRFLGLAAGAAAAAGGVQVLRTTVFDDDDGESAAPDSDSFRQAVGTTFRFAIDALSIVDLKLSHVTKAPPDPRAEELTGESFALTFEPVGKPTAVAQGTYSVRHRQLGRFPLFVAPADQSKSYAAVINRRVPKALAS